MLADFLGRQDSEDACEMVKRGRIGMLYLDRH